MRHNSASAKRLREAIDAYTAQQKDKFDPYALNLLARLADHADAADICERLNLDEFSFLTLCIWVEQVARTYAGRVKKLPKTLARLERLEKSVAELHGFVAEQTKVPATSDLLTMWTPRKPETIAAMTRGLGLIAALIASQQYVAHATPLRLGGSGKKQQKTAADNAAIWSLADAVRRGTRKARWREIADLAQIILETEVSIERAREAWRNGVRSSAAAPKRGVFMPQEGG